MADFWCRGIPGNEHVPVEMPDGSLICRYCRQWITQPKGRP